MTSVAQFAQYLLKLDPQRLPARLALYNYLKHMAEPTMPFTPGVIQTFYARVLQFEFWQREAGSLAATIRADLTSYAKNQPMENDPSWGLIRHPDSLQVIRLAHGHDLEDIVDSEYAARRKSGDKVKWLRISDSQVMVLIVLQSGGLEVKVYPSSVLVWGSRLRLMAPTSHLQYTSALDLVPHARQIVEGSLLTTLCFHTDSDGVHGLVTRGHTFQKFETFIRAKLTETQDLFYSLKRLERHFINAQSDPYYQEVVALLEKAHKNLAHPNADTILAADKAITKGRLVLRNVFPNDRLLQILVTHLEYGITQQRANAEKIIDQINPRSPQ